MVERTSKRANQTDDPTPEIPAVESDAVSLEPTNGSAETSLASSSPASSVRASRQSGLRIAARPGSKEVQKEVRVIRVRTVDDITVIINAEDYDPEEHTPVSENDKKWGEIAVAAKIQAQERNEQDAYIKRLVRGRG